MTSKSIVRFSFVLCIVAALAVAMCGCDDLGAYEDTEQYYDCFGDVVFINAATGEVDDYSVEDYFYNEDSREDFLAGEDGAYKGVEHGEYVYVAIPFESTIDMDALALYIQSTTDVTVYINVFLTDEIPSAWRPLVDDNMTENESDGTEKDSSDDSSDESEEEETYDDPDPDTRIGEIAINLKQEVWNSFVLDAFTVDGSKRNSIQIEDGQYILLQIRNNSGVRIFDEEKQVYVDPQTGLELPRAQITMTNLLIRAVDIQTEDEQQGG